MLGGGDGRHADSGFSCHGSPFASVPGHYAMATYTRRPGTVQL